ncbi:activating signal cointegrator 1 complex subunit 1-like isoform X2 [Aethina tumida]|uniref:activating signal cointegrator 1 complex subunit 1-like isoform X2 n=1 Tax=Aethina tumida TaxID=116153 RepID=UPI002148F69F|nr:activating signal cointegrator 1 complex subunit 1-like isoform X2 [Aethina tumida]
MFKNISNKKPIRMWIDGKCFNIKEIKRKSKETTVTDTTSSSNETNTQSIQENEEFNGNMQITCDNGKFTTSFCLPKLYYEKIFKFPELNLKSLSDETETEIHIPTKSENGKLMISGASEENIKLVLKELLPCIGQIRKQTGPVQFLAIKTTNEEIICNFEKFKSEVLSLDGIKGMHESIFQKAEKLHLTIDVLSLLNEQEINEAITALNEYKHKLNEIIEKFGPLKIRISGLDCMNNTTNNVHVMYSNAEIVSDNQEASLQTIVNNIAEYFYEKGLLKSYSNPVKLHMTVINTKYRQGTPKKGYNRKWQKRIPFDATKIMDKYKDFYFGECIFDSVYLCLISTKGDDGFYKPIHAIHI